MTTLYIAGPMRGIPEFNFPAFYDAEDALTYVNFDTINPARRDADLGFNIIGLTGNEDLAEHGFDLNEALAWDLEQIAKHADGIALLDGWENSSGAAAEIATAKALGKPVKTVDEWVSGPFKKGDRVRVAWAAHYTADDIEHDIDPVFLGEIGVISEERDFDGDCVVEFPHITSSVGFERSEAISEECLTLVEEPEPPRFTVAALHEHMTSIDEFVKELAATAKVPDVLVTEGEVRVTSATGGQKGKKAAELGTVDPLALLVLAEVSGFGAQKYEAFNYLKGYDWSLSFNALTRHLLAFWNGEDLDDESGLPHITHAAWHALALTSFLKRGLGTDDRYKGEDA